MKVKFPTTIEVDITHVELVLPILHGDEEIPFDFPLRKGDVWRAKVNLDTRKIECWPEGTAASELHLKVSDAGSYYLLDQHGVRRAELENNYVPHGVVPGSYGDYVELQIAADGTILNWPRVPDFSEFFPEG